MDDIKELLDNPELLEEVLKNASPEYAREIKWLITARPEQIPPKSNEWVYWVFRAGRACVAKGTLIYDPIKDVQIPVENWTGGPVNSIDRYGKKVIAQSSESFIKGQTHLYQVRTSRGDEIKVTDEHQFLTKKGWVRLKDISIGDEILCPQHPCVPSKLQLDDLYSKHTDQDCQDDCCQQNHQCGQQPHQATVNDPTSTPLLADAQQHDQNSSYLDDCDKQSQCNQNDHAYDHFYGAQPYQDEQLEQDDQSQPQSCAHGQLLHRRQQLLKSLLSSNSVLAFDEQSPCQQTSVAQVSPCDDHLEEQQCCPHQATCEQHACSHHTCLQATQCYDRQQNLDIDHENAFLFSTDLPECELKESGSTWQPVYSIQYVGIQDYYDLQVAGTNNYEANGTYNHNSGKTRACSEWVRSKVEIEGARHILLVGTNASNARDIMVKGPSGILSICPTARFVASERKVVWENGAEAKILTAEEPEAIRGFSTEYAWLDEISSWKYERETWSNVIACVREGAHPQIAITSTPQRTSIMKEIESFDDTHLSVSTTYDNQSNLSPTFLKSLEETYKNTTMYNQEVLGEYLEALEGAVWEQDDIIYGKPIENVEWDMGVIGIDPAVTTSETSDETGIIVAARTFDISYVLEDLSGKHPIDAWAQIAVMLQEKYHFPIIVESNQGGDFVTKAVLDKNPFARIKKLHAINSKADRLASAAMFYQQHKVLHIERFEKLEAQMLSWVPPELGKRSKSKFSPDRADALSHAIRYLMGKKKAPASIILPKLNRINNTRRIPQ